MREQLERRLQELKAEFEAGQSMLAEHETKQANLRETMLRISGAIQVLEEALNQEDQPAGDDAGRLDGLEDGKRADGLKTADREVSTSGDARSARVG